MTLYRVAEAYPRQAQRNQRTRRSLRMQKTAVSNTAQRIVLEHDVGIEVIPLGKIEVDVQYQRRLSRGKVRQIVNNWDNRAAGSLLVSWRQNDQIVVIDGQHRLAAMRQLHIHKAP